MSQPDSFISFANLAQCRLRDRKCALFKAYTGGRGWKVIGDRFLKPCYLIRDDHNRKIELINKEQDSVSIPS